MSADAVFNAISLLDRVEIRIHYEWEKDYRGNARRKVWVLMRFQHEGRSVEYSKYHDQTPSEALAIAWEAFSKMLYASVEKSEYTPALLTQDMF